MAVRPTGDDDVHREVQAGRGAPAPKPTPHPANLTIRDYLSREAGRITENALADLKTAAEFQRAIPQRRRRYMEMMGLADLASPKDPGPVPHAVTGVRHPEDVTGTAPAVVVLKSPGEERSRPPERCLASMRPRCRSARAVRCARSRSIPRCSTAASSPCSSSRRLRRRTRRATRPAEGRPSRCSTASEHRPSPHRRVASPNSDRRCRRVPVDVRLGGGFPSPTRRSGRVPPGEGDERVDALLVSTP